MQYTAIQLSESQGVARLVLHRPDKLNSFTEVMHGEVRHALDSVQESATARVLVITGAGRGFCAGQDLADDCMQKINGKMPDIGTVVERILQPRRSKGIIHHQHEPKFFRHLGHCINITYVH